MRGVDKVNFIALGKNIRKYRKAAKLSQEKLAEMCECSNGHIGMIENAKTTPSLEMIVKISNSLKVTVDMLINESYVQPELKYLQDIETKLEKYPRNKRIVIGKAMINYMHLIDALLKQ